MAILGIIFLTLFIISAILLIIFILLQDEQGEGIGGLFGGGSSSAFGSRSGNVLTKFTSILAAIFLTCSFGLAWVNRTSESGDVIGAARREKLKEQGQFNWWEDTESNPSPEAGTQPGETVNTLPMTDSTSSNP